jgi:hypothetical protein
MKGYGRCDGKMTGANNPTDDDFSIKLVANIKRVERFWGRGARPLFAAVLRSGRVFRSSNEPPTVRFFQGARS